VKDFVANLARLSGETIHLNEHDLVLG